MSKDPTLPPRVYPKGRWFYLATAEGKKRVWTKLTRIRDGVPPLYRKLADLAARDIAPERMPALVVDWLKEVSEGHANKTQANEKWVTTAISNAFAGFRAGDITPPDCTTFLKQFRSNRAPTTRCAPACVS